MKLTEKHIYKGLNVLFIDKDNTLYAAKRYSILKSRDLGNSWECDGKLAVSFNQRLPCINRMTTRLLRLGVHGFVRLPDGSRVCIARKGIYRAMPGDSVYEKVHHIERGSRPLTICVGSKDALYWGEYFDNPDRDAVNIYASFDKGKTWEICYTFPPQTVRHIHGIFYDGYDDCYWIVTGDYEKECCIYRTTNQFKTLHIVRSGGQQNRCFSLQVTNNKLFYATDTPLEQNFIYAMDKNTGEVTRLQAIQSSAFYSCKVKENIFISTAIEPSRINLTRYSNIWGTSNHQYWFELAKFKKDVWPKKYFQYGMIFFPGGVNKTDYLFFSGLAVDEIDNCFVRMRLVEDDGSD
jgi:hypothetical protein